MIMTEESESQPLDFSKPEFDANLYASKMVLANRVSEALITVNDEIRNLDTSIYQHVADHHKDLLKKATELDNLHQVLQLTEEKITNLSVSMDKVKRKIHAPHGVLQQHITRFRHLQVTSEILRKIARIAVLVKRVQARTGDLSKLSGYVNEMEYLFSHMDWKGIHVLESYKRAMEQSREDMISQAWSLVNTSYELADQAQLGLGLQVFQHYGMLSDVVTQLIKQWQTDFQLALADAIDVEKLTQRIRCRQSNTASGVSGPGRASLTGVGGQAAAFHVAMWTSLDGTIDRLERFLLQCRLLGLTLLKQRDATPGVVLCNPICRIGDPIDPHPSLAELLLDQLVRQWQRPDYVERRASLVLSLASVHVIGDQLRIDPELLKSHLQLDSSSCIQRGLYDNLTELRAELGASEGFLGWAANLLSEQLSQAASQSAQIKEPLDGEYPKLLKLVLDLGRRLHQTETQGLDDSRGDAVQSTPPIPMCMLRALSTFETAYLSRSLSRLFDRVALAFSACTSNSSSAPDATELDGIVQNAVNELAYATVHYDLLCKVSRNVAKMVAMFATKVEGLIAVGPSAEQCMDAQTPSQQNNIRLVNLLCAFGTQLELTCNRRLRNLPVLQTATSCSTPLSSPFEVIQEALTTRLNSLCLAILEPLLRSVSETLEEILGTVHGENISDSDITDIHPSNTTQIVESKYMKNCQDFLSRVRRQYFSGLSRTPSSRLNSNTNAVSELGLSSLTEGSYPCGEAALQSAIRPFLSRWIDTFLEHISLVRPLDDRGKMRLTTDCVEFELALAPLTAPAMGFTLAALVPDNYAKLRAFRPILTTDTEQIVEAFTKSKHDTTARPTQLDTSRLSPSLVCQHLFSRAPAEIRSPHDAVGWSTLRYISWIQSGRSESERLSFLRNGLSVYTREVEMRQQREYAPIYLQLRAFLYHYTSVDQAQAGKQTASNDKPQNKEHLIACA